jgi:hypothetical protein
VSAARQQVARPAQQEGNVPDFQLVKAPVFSPTRCTTCHTGRCDEGFVDMLVDGEAVHGYNADGAVIRNDGQANFGHLYLCVMCLKQAATKIGWASAQHAMDAYAENETLAGEIHRLEIALAAERARPLQVVDANTVVDRLLELSAAAG